MDTTSTQNTGPLPAERSWSRESRVAVTEVVCGVTLDLRIGRLFSGRNEPVLGQQFPRKSVRDEHEDLGKTDPIVSNEIQNQGE